MGRFLPSIETHNLFSIVVMSSRHDVVAAESISLWNLSLSGLYFVLVIRVVPLRVTLFYYYVQLPTPILYRPPWVPGWLPLFPFLDGANHRSMNVFSTQVQVPTSPVTRTSTRLVRRPIPSRAAPIYRQTKLKSQGQGRIRRKRWDYPFIYLL